MSSDTKRLVSYRLEPKLIEALRTRAKTEGKDQTEVVEAALKMYLGLPWQTIVTLSTSSTLEQRMSEIEKQISDLARNQK